MQTKKCTRCLKRKPYEAFRKAPAYTRYSCGVWSWCIACQLDYGREYREKNRERLKKMRAKYRNQNREGYRRYNADYYLKVTKRKRKLKKKEQK